MESSEDFLFSDVLKLISVDTVFISSDEDEITLDDVL
jgi:hypothetical protein